MKPAHIHYDGERFWCGLSAERDEDYIRARMSLEDAARRPVLTCTACVHAGIDALRAIPTPEALPDAP